MAFALLFNKKKIPISRPIHNICENITNQHIFIYDRLYDLCIYFPTS